MPKITRDEIVQNSGYQYGVDTVQNSVSMNSLKGLETVRYRSVDETVALIIRAVAKANRPITRTEICKAVKRSKSPRMVQMIEWLVEDGKLKRDHQLRSNGVVVYYYSLAIRVDDRGNELPSWLE